MTDLPNGPGMDRAQLLLNAAVDGELGDAEREEWDALRASDPSLAEAEAELRALTEEMGMLRIDEDASGGGEVEGFVAEVTDRVKAADRLGERAVAEGLLAPKALRELLHKQERYRRRGKKVPRLGELLVHAGHLKKKQVKRLLREQAKAKEVARPTEPPARKKRPTKRHFETKALSELVAQLNEETKQIEAEERAASSTRQTGGSSVATAMGRAYRRLESQEDPRYRRAMMQAAIAAGLACIIAANGFFFWSKNVQREKNAETARLVEERRVKDEPVHVKPAEVEQRKSRQQLRVARAIKQHADVLREFKRMHQFDRKKLEHLIRMTQGTISQGRKDWNELGDAYNLLARLEYYWAYTDRHGQIQTSVKKDHVSLALRAIQKAQSFYARPDAESSLKLTLHPWMPEYREPGVFCHASKLKGGRRVREVRTKDRKYALLDLEVFEAGVKANPY